MSNQIYALLTARIRALLEASRDVDSLSHGPTVGAAREQQLREFLFALLPPPFAITSGFVSDPLDVQTPQVDLIVYDPSRIPPIVLAAETAIVPSDSALLLGEIKSTLTTATLEQVSAQHKAIKRMAHSGESAGDESSLIIPQILVAFDSAVAVETLASWLDECPNLGLVCVLNSVTIARTTSGRSIVHGSLANNYLNVRTFIMYFFNLIQQVARKRQKVLPRIALYLVPELRGVAG